MSSDNPCPHCGKREWWLGTRVVDKKMKYVTNISYCSKCNWHFKQTHPLHAVGRNNKLRKDEESRKPSAYNLFVSEALKDGKGIAEAVKLWRKHKLEAQSVLRDAFCSADGDVYEQSALWKEKYLEKYRKMLKGKEEVKTE